MPRDETWLQVDPEYLDRMKTLSEAVMFPSTKGRKMKIMQLTREDIPLVTKGGNQELVDEITRELDLAELTNRVVYVRYGPMFLQRMFVDRYYLDRPEVQEMLLDDNWWSRKS